MRNRITLLIYAVIFTSTLLHAAECAAQGASCRADEYELMSLLVREQYGSEFSLILIGSETEPWCLQEQLGFLRRKWPELKSETIDSLIVCNSGRVGTLDGSFSVPVDYRLLSESEYLRALGRNPDDSEGVTIRAAAPAGSGLEAYSEISGPAEPDWDGFDREFPDAQGYLTFSRIGFDSNCTQALVIFSNAYRCSGFRVRPQTRRVACFLKEEGKWELVGVSRGIDAMDR